MSGDFDDLPEAERRLTTALQDRLDSAGLTVFDVAFSSQPPGRPVDKAWGGYRLEFKLIPRGADKGLASMSRRRDQAVSIDGSGGGKRRFKIEISKFEFCDAKVELDVEGVPCFVYSPTLIAVEKLRAICQQMPDYPYVRNKKGRARDFYDIHAVVDEAGVALDAPENRRLIGEVFSAKQVPLNLLAKIQETRGFHAPDWVAVQDAIAERIKGFDFYFDFVVKEIRRLESLWME